MQETGYIFIITLLHSLWQSALLWTIIRITTAKDKRLSPLLKRNLMLYLLPVQLLLSVSTFCILHSGQSLFPAVVTVPAPYGMLPDYAVGICVWSYSAMALYKMISIQISRGNLKKAITHSLVPAPAGIRSFTDWHAESFQIGRKVSVWVSEHISTPFTCGFLKPAILLPAALLNRLTIEETESVIIHELAHIRNNDYIVNYALLVMEALYFFNPAVLRIIKEIRLEREKACDLNVLNFEYAPVSYAETLLKIAEGEKRQFHTGIGITGGRGQLEKRVRFITANQKFHAVHSGKKGLIIGITAIALLLSLAPVSLKRTVPRVTAEKIIIRKPVHAVNDPSAGAVVAAPIATAVKPAAKRKKAAAAIPISETASLPISETATARNSESPSYEAFTVSSSCTRDEKTVILEEETEDGIKEMNCYRVWIQNGRVEKRLLWKATVQNSTDTTLQ